MRVVHLDTESSDAITYFRSVIGVAGNHDEFGARSEREGLQGMDGVHLLDGANLSREAIERAQLNTPRVTTKRGDCS